MTDNLPIKIHVNKTGNRVRIRIKSEYYLEHLKPETTKLIGSTGDKLNLKIVKMFLVSRLLNQFLNKIISQNF